MVSSPPASAQPPTAPSERPARPAPVDAAPATPDRDATPAVTRLERGLLLALTLGALALRLFRLDAQSMWLDEAGRVEIARLGLGGVVQGVAVLELCPPLYHALAALWIGLTGDSDFAVRLLSACTGLLTVPLSWALARRLLGPAFPYRLDLGRLGTLGGAGVVGLGAALAAAISPFYVFYAQEAAQYSLLLLLALLHVYLFVRLWQAPERRPLWPALFAVTVAGLYTQYYFGFLLAGEGLFALGGALIVGARAFLMRWLLVMVGAALLFAPWLPLLRRQAWLAAANTGWGYPDPLSAAGTVWSTTWLGFDTRLPAALVLIACLPPLLFGLWAQWRRPAALLLMAGVVLVPFALAVGSALYFHSFRERGFLIAGWVPYGLLGAALAWALDRRSDPSTRETLRRFGGRLAGGAWALAAFAVMALALVNSYRYVEKENWRAAVAWVQAEERPGDGIFFIHYGMQVPFDRYYRGALERNGLPFDFDWLEGYYKRNVFNALDVGSSLAPRAERYRRVWLVLSHDGARGSDVAIAYLDRAFHRVEAREWTGVRVLLYERPATRARAIDLGLQEPAGRVLFHGRSVARLEAPIAAAAPDPVPLPVGIEAATALAAGAAGPRVER